MVPISVITTHRNTPDLLAETIASVQAQTVAPLEHIIIDDNSDYLPDVKCDVRIRLDPRQGPEMGRQAAVAIARGEWVAFCDGDDTLEPDFIKETWTECQTGLYQVVYVNAFHSLTAHIVEHNYLPDYACVLRKEWLKVGGTQRYIYPWIPQPSDWHMWVKGWLAGWNVKGVERKLHNKRMREGSISNSWSIDQLWEMHAIMLQDILDNWAWLADDSAKLDIIRKRLTWQY